MIRYYRILLLGIILFSVNLSFSHWPTAQPSILELIQESEYICLVINTSLEKNTAEYKIIKNFKSILTGKIIFNNVKTPVFEKYRQGRVDSSNEVDSIFVSRNEEAILFLNKDLSLVKGALGKVITTNENKELLTSSIEELILFSKKTMTESQFIDYFVNNFENDNQYFHNSLIREITKIDLKKHVEKIKLLLNSKNKDVRSYVISLLGKAKVDTVIPQLIECMLNDPDVNVRYSAAIYTGTYNDARITPAYIEAFQDKDPGVRLMVVRSLINRKDKTLDIFEKALNDTSEMVIIEGIRGFDRYYHPDIISKLTLLTNHNSDKVRQQAKYSLERQDKMATGR
ncbi:TPA: hypothetical protein DCR49_12400 [Candidatus Delongbacteria bacterium]|nr:MAG: hypothetical protein A2Y39_06230 [Candidatus Delongbacteria bacterium GWF2_40_14]HAQ62768.1 hypothetical protein [Candidatus Delongbacteria bacterium]